MKIQATLLYNNKKNHDKIYGVFLIDNYTFSIYGNRKKRLKFGKIEITTDDLFYKKLINEKVLKPDPDEKYEILATLKIPNIKDPLSPINFQNYFIFSDPKSIEFASVLIKNCFIFLISPITYSELEKISSGNFIQKFKEFRDNYCNKISNIFLQILPGTHIKLEPPKEELPKKEIILEPTKEKIKQESPKEHFLKLKCIDNSGFETQFTKNIEYLGKEISDKLYEVINNLNEKKNMIKSRFKQL